MSRKYVKEYPFTNSTPETTMSYTITAKVSQTKQNAFFRVVERTAWNYANGGTWGEADGTQNFIITFGVHNYKRWGDIVTNLANEETGVIITPQYYGTDHPDRVSQREKQLTSYSVKNNKGRSFSFNYTVTDGHHLKVDIVIG
ncbi:lectin [Russula vinacea]|nr:lectin [Russula vinacea]